MIVPVDPTIDLIFVKIALFGLRRSSDFHFVLDTACVTTLVTPETADRLGYSARDGERTATVTTALGREPGYLLRIAELFTFGQGFGDFRVNVHDLPDTSGIDGLLGLDFLRRFNYEIRSKEGRIRAEIVLAYPDQWVILTELDKDEMTLEIHTAVVRGHGSTRREAWETAQIPDEDGRPIAQYFTGRMRSPRPW